MKALVALLLLTVSANAQQINNSTVNLIGSLQNVTIIQSGANHSATISLDGYGLSAIINQSGTTPQSVSLSVTCNLNCPSNPYIINQY